MTTDDNEAASDDEAGEREARAPLDNAGPRSWRRAFGRGFAGRCPQCGRGALFAGYVKTRETCAVCGLDLAGHRADDAPPYITMMIIGHVVIPLALAHKQLFDPPLFVQFAVWTPAIVLATGALLPPVKGALIGLQWANRMHGFAGRHADASADV